MTSYESHLNECVVILIFCQTLIVDLLEIVSLQTGYDPKERAEISNAFSTAAFRKGHSQIPEMVKMINPNNGVERQFHFSEVSISKIMPSDQL